ncbi:efflux RND transporter periplasmic adaptor subunit [Vibrio nigripulchritudo]|uniref:efflux RND transporter periplasmic adaptor subunit n=1 Tax=Vibrio nigripulchritudo TaxID=28173 RepID=UPI0005F9BD04|nr:efflux RND transporter periplasmic adaptor subunit [Vibrio nigripulchritudo]KJY76339.1 hemolysin D [Vibrio nigripulchritudo]
MKSSKLLLGIGLFSVLIVLFIFMAGGFTEKVNHKALTTTDASDIETVTLRYQETPQIREFTGTVIADQKAQLSARVTAKVVEVLVDIGDSVTKGDVIMRLESDDLDARVQQTEQGLSSAQANLNAARKEFKRISELVERKLLPQSEFDRVESQLKTARAIFKQAQAAVKEAETTFGFSIITAPFDGVVTQKPVNEGDTATPGALLVSLYNPESLQLEVNISESLITSIAVGDQLNFNLPTSRHTGRANIVEISPSADQSSRSFLVKLALPVSPSVYPGVYGKVHVLSHSESVLTLPENSVYQVGQLDYVRIVEEGKIKTQLVQLGQNNQVRKGLHEGDEVVLNPLKLN